MPYQWLTLDQFLAGVRKRLPSAVLFFKDVPVDWRRLNLDIKQGANTIEYRDEYPHIRKMFQEQLAKEGAALHMPNEVYL